MAGDVPQGDAFWAWLKYFRESRYVIRLNAEESVGLAKLILDESPASPKLRQVVGKRRFPL